MTRQPDICVWVKFRYIGVEVDCRFIVPILVIHRLVDACQIRRVGLGLAVTNLSPKIRPSLTAATTEEEVVIFFVSRGRPRPIEKSWRSSFQRYYDSPVCLIRVYVTTQSVRLPPKA